MKSFLLMLLTVQSETAAQTAAQPQTLDLSRILDLLLVLMFLGCGVYCVYTFIRLCREQMLFDNKVLYPGDCKYQDCADPVGFMEFIRYRVLALGVFLVLCGVLAVLNSYVIQSANQWISIGLIVLPLLGFVWYTVIQRKAAKRFW